MKTRPGTRSASPPPVATRAPEAPALPPWKAFVVQFSDVTCPRSGVFSGRVEHLNSARRARFTSPQELLAILTSLLDTLPEETK